MQPARPSNYVALFAAARKSSDVVVVEGIHAVKHALRFGARFQHMITAEPERVRAVARELAADIEQPLLAAATTVPPDVFDRCVPVSQHLRVAGIAERPAYSLRSLTAAAVSAPIVALEAPRIAGNLGAAIRVCAAAGVGGVLAIGGVDVWHAATVRGSAGLHFALPVVAAKLADLPSLGREIVALDPEGIPLPSAHVHGSAIFAFGTERHGISEELAALADLRVSIPMRPGVSSLNLATAVAACLYGLGAPFG